MKLKILLTVFILSLSTFLTIRENENIKLWNKIQNVDSEAESVFFINMSNTDDKAEDFYATLIKYAKDYDLTLQLDRGDIETGIFDAYYYNGDNRLLLDVPLTNLKDAVDFSQLNNSQFYSTKDEPGSSGLLFTYYPYNVSKYTINNFANVVSNKVRLTGEISIFGGNDIIQEMLMELKFKFGDNSIVQIESVFSEKEVNSPINTMIVLSILLFSMVYLQEISTKSKEISLRLIQGQSLLLVCLKLYFPIFFKSITYYILFNLLLYLLIIGSINTYTVSLMFELVKSLGVFIVMIFLVLVIVLFTMAFVPKNLILKNKTINQYINMISFVIKVSLIVSLLPSSYFITKDMFTDYQSYSELKKYSDNFKYLTEVASIYHHSDTGTQESLDAILSTGQSLLLEYDNSYPIERYSMEVNNISYNFVAIEYSFYDRFLKESLPGVNPNGVTALVRNANDPVPYNVSLEENYNLINVDYDYKIPYVGGNSATVENPILAVYPNTDVFTQKHKKYRVKNISFDKNDTIDIRSRLNGMLGDKLNFGGHENKIRLELISVMDILRERVLKFGQFILTLIFVVILGNLTLISTKESESAIMLSLGYSNFKRKVVFLSNHILIFILCLYYLLVNNVPIVDSLLISVSIILCDYLVISYILFLEKSKVLRIIKRG